MNMKRSMNAAAMIAAIAAGSSAMADGVDVWVQILNGQLATGAIEEGGAPIAANWRVFGAEFGEDKMFPFFADEPGFEMFDGTVTAFTPFQINIAGAVERWNGGGFSSTAETMTLAFGPGSVTSGNGYISGFTFFADDEGGFHDHFDISIDGDGGDPNDGIYLLPLTISSADFGETLTFWFVMNLGQDERLHDEVIDWVVINLVPAPAALAFFALAGIGGSRRRARG